MLRVGAHVSISGGVQNAAARQRELGGNCGQIFVGSPRGWAVSDVDPDDADKFRAYSQDQDIGPWIVHGTYLVNLATPKDDLAEKSLQCVQAELDAAAELGIPYYVFHPGAHTGAGEETAVSNVAERISTLDVPETTTLLLENTAGKGTTVGKTMGQLETMIARSSLDRGDEVGVCLDSCHLFAAGYDIRADGELAALVDEIESEFGLEVVHYLHLNDSKHPLGSEKDEHAHIGKGEIGDEGFARFINHEAFRDLPMVLETPTNGTGYEWNIDRIKALYEAE